LLKEDSKVEYAWELRAKFVVAHGQNLRDFMLPFAL